MSGKAQVYGNARVFGKAQVYGNARVFGKAQVYGNARVYSKLDSGEWRKSPLFIMGSKYSFCVSGTDSISIGCQDHKIRGWIDKYESIAITYGDADLIDEYVNYFNLALKLYWPEIKAVKIKEVVQVALRN